jgi:hypothetical protein
VVLFVLLGCSWCSLSGLASISLVVLGLSWDLLGPLGMLLECSWGFLWSLRVLLGCSWSALGVLGELLVLLGCSKWTGEHVFGGLEARLGGSWGLMRCSWDGLGASWGAVRVSCGLLTDPEG